MSRCGALPGGLPQDVACVASVVLERVLRACDAGEAVRRNWPPVLDRADRVRVLAFGKASVPMTIAAVGLLGDRLDTGVVVSPDAFAGVIGDDRIAVFGADHPLPTARNAQAAHAIEVCARSASPDQVTLVLISGGGSAHLTLPRAGVGLEEIQAVTAGMLRAGATIEELNRARSRMERLKAGGLRAACTSRRVVGLVLSDVIGDDLGTVASGPLGTGSHDDWDRITELCVIGNNAMAVGAASDALAACGVSAGRMPGSMRGHAIEAGRAFAAGLRMQPGGLVWGGETTVDVGAGTGLGGRCLEVGFGAALGMPDDRAWAIMTLATDGIDGPTDAAGAVLTSEMFGDGRSDRVVRAAMDNHDSFRLGEQLGALIRTGPTGTNINDIAAGWWR